MAEGRAQTTDKAMPADLAAPQVSLLVSGNSIPLSAESQQKIARQVEDIIGSSEIVPEGIIVRMLEANYDSEQIKATGSYLHILYPADKEVVPGNSALLVKEVFLGLADNPNVRPYHGYTGGSYPGYPGSICLISPHNILRDYSARSSEKNGDRLIELGLDADIHSHLTAKMKATVDLVAAVQKGDADALKKLIAQGADVKSIQGPEGSLLCYAANPEVAEILLRQGIPVDARDSQFQPALIHICGDHRRDRASIAPGVTVLLKHGADPNSVMMGNSSMDAVMFALDGATVDALVAAGAKISSTCAWRSTGLEMPFRSLSYYQALVRYGLDLKRGPWRGSQGLFLLLSACKIEGKEDLVEWLLNQGVDPNGVFYFGDYPNGLPKTPLEQALSSKNAKAVKVLIAHGAKSRPGA
jgi:ankyrin repeat protein